MGSANDNEDQSAHPMDQDNHPTNPPSQPPAAPHNDKDSINVESNSSPPQSLSHHNNILESNPTPQLSHTDNKATVPQQSQSVNNAQLKADAQQPQIESALSDNNITVPHQFQNEAATGHDNEKFDTSPQKPLTQAAPADKDAHFKSNPQQPQTEAVPCDNDMEFKSSLEQPRQGSSSPAPSDDNKILLEPEIEPSTEGKTKVNERSDCKSETCGIDGTSNSISDVKTSKLMDEAKVEPSKVSENKSSHHAGAEHCEPATPHAESSSIKTELENKGELKIENNEMDIAAINNNGNSSSKNSFLWENDHDGNESGSEEEQSAFMKELENFFRERSMEFKPPKFYGEGLNCLKLWRAVMRLGGYDKVTSCKLWRQVGESFKPPKTCTTVSWTFRGFYEKALLDYERHKIPGGDLNLPLTSNSEPMVVDNQTPGSGRARRDAAARAMQGWHSQRLLGNGEVSDAIIKDKNSAPLQKREKPLKNLGLLKRKKPSYTEHAVKAARAKTSNPQLDVEVVDLGPPADWVKINVQKTKDSFEVYALVPGLLREEVRVQSDPAGRLVISGEPAHPDNHWGVTPFKKVVSLPSRIDPHQTSAVVTLHGQLFVRVPFEQPD